MSFEMEMPESTDTGGGNFLREPGTYHFACMEVDEQPTNKAGDKMLDGFRVVAEVLNGDTAGQEGKSVELMFFKPKLTDKNNGEMAKKKQARFAIATGVLGAPKAAGEKVAVDLQQAVHRQFVATVSLDDREDDPKKRFLQLHFADIFHVDDPAVAKVPKSEAALKLLPAGLRRTAGSFGKPGDKKPANGNGNGTAHPGGTKPAAGAAASASTVEVGDL